MYNLIGSLDFWLTCLTSIHFLTFIYFGLQSFFFPCALELKNQRVLLGAHGNSTSPNSRFTHQSTYPALGNPVFLWFDKPTIKM